MKQVDFIVCGNGYGHIKRVCNVISYLDAYSFKINVFCPHKQFVFAKENLGIEKFSNVVFSDKLHENEISWLTPIHYTMEKYSLWREQISNNKVLQNSDLIISDNQILPVQCFYEKAILMGSFLWPWATVYKEPLLQRISEKEKSWMSQFKPKLLCVNDMVMRDEMKSFADIVGLPWFVESVIDHYNKNEKMQSILFTGGGTGDSNNELLLLAEKLFSEDEQIQIYLDSGLFELACSRNLKFASKFDYAINSFVNLSGVICRPGMGILSDCVRYKIPIFALVDGINHELKHNAIRIQKMGIGNYFNTKLYSLEQIASQIVMEISDLQQMRLKRDMFSHIETGGAKYAANKIIEYAHG